jgi:hypothetical protein
MFLERLERLLDAHLGFGHGMIVGVLSTARGRPLSPASLRRLRAATARGYYVYVAVDPKLFPSYGTGPFLGLPIDRRGEVSASLGPGVYLLEGCVRAETRYVRAPARVPPDQGDRSCRPYDSRQYRRGLRDELNVGQRLRASSAPSV